VAVLGGGKVLQVDTPEGIYHNPRNLFIADFLGDSHFLPLETRNGELCLDGVPLKLPSNPPQWEKGSVLLVRPEKLELLTGGDDGDYNRIEGKVERRMFLGDSVLLTVSLSGEVEVSVKVLSRHLQTRRAPGPGERVILGLHAQDTFLLPAQDASSPASGGSGLP
jgi:putative spermidine/putrescine transport system ATP-binding protein